MISGPKSASMRSTAVANFFRILGAHKVAIEDLDADMRRTLFVMAASAPGRLGRSTQSTSVSVIGKLSFVDNGVDTTTALDVQVAVEHVAGT